MNGAATIIYHDGLVAAFCYVNTNNVHRETSPNDSDNPQLLTGRTLLQYERKALVLPHPANQHIPVRLRTQTAFSGPETVSVPQWDVEQSCPMEKLYHIQISSRIDIKRTGKPVKLLWGYELKAPLFDLSRRIGGQVSLYRYPAFMHFLWPDIYVWYYSRRKRWGHAASPPRLTTLGRQCRAFQGISEFRESTYVGITIAKAPEFRGQIPQI